MKRGAAFLVLLLVAALAACAGDDDSIEPVGATSCSRLLYEGEGEPDVVVVSDFPRRGVGAKPTKLMIDAIELVLRQRAFRAGEFRVGYQSCNDTLGAEPYDEALCRANARAYVATDDVVGIIGPWNSGCAVEQIPIVSRTAAGPLAMVSPSNTFIALTRSVPGGGQVASSLYRDGVRSYFRVVTHDFGQGIAAASLAENLGATRVAVLRQDLRDDYVRGLFVSFRDAARALGIEPVEFEWRFREDYARLAASVAAAQPGAVYMAGLTQENAKRLVEDLRAALPRVPLIAPDSFAAGEIALDLGAAGEGMYVTVPGIPGEKLPPAGKRFVADLGATTADEGQPGAPEAAQAAIVLLDAIARSDGTRASVVDQLSATNVSNGILGSFRFDRFGDITPAPVGVYRFRRGEIVAEDVIRAPLELIR